MALLQPLPARRLPSARDIALTLTIGFLVCYHGLPALAALAREDGQQAPRATLSTAFTHQGRLVVDGIPANGAYDFEFALFDSAAGGSPVATMPPLSGVGVTNGLYSVQLDFGDNAFTGEALWLHVRAKPAGAGSYTDLGRQALTATPYALYAGATDWAGITNKPSGLDDGDSDTTYSAQSPVALDGTAFGLSSAGCQAGDVWKWDGDGWSCDPDIVGDPGATYTAANPLSLSGTTFGLSTTGCEAGDVWTFVGPGWSCDTPVAGGDITAVNAGPGLTGGAQAGAATLSANFGGNGSANTLSRSDHTHAGQAWSSGAFFRTFQVTNTSDSIGSSAIMGITTGEFTAGVAGDATALGGVGVAGTSRINGGADQTVEDRAIGVVGRVCSELGSCIFADGTAGLGAGVYGESTGGPGVSALGTVGVLSEGLNTGVRSKATGPGGIGVAGTGRNIGVLGSNIETAPQSCGDVNLGLASFCIGIHGDSINRPASIGVSGYANWIGVRGQALDPNGYGGLFVGKLWHSGPLEQPSDAKFKTNISGGAGLDEILQLRPVSFDWKEGMEEFGTGRQQGLIAQEVQEVLPDLVSEVNAPGVERHLALNYTELIPVLIRAIQEQQAEIDSLTGSSAGGSSSPLWTAAAMAAAALALAATGTAVALRRRA